MVDNRLRELLLYRRENVGYVPWGSSSFPGGGLANDTASGEPADAEMVLSRQTLVHLEDGAGC